MLMQEVDQTVAQQQKLATMATKLDSEVALLEQSGAASSPSTTTTSTTVGGPTKSSRSGRKKRGTKRDQQISDRTAAAVVNPAADHRPLGSVDLATLHNVQAPATVMPPSPAVHTVGGIRASLVMAPSASPGSSRLPNIRFVNGDDSHTWFPKHASPLVAAGLRVPHGRHDSSSSTDSAETVRHLEHGVCVGDVDRYLTAATAMIHLSSGPGTFAAPSAVSSPPGMRFYLRPALLSGVSFPASRSELEQYKQVVHGSANIPPSEVATQKAQSPRVRQRLPGRGRGRKAHSSADANMPRNVPVATSSTVPRFFSVGVMPPSASMPAVRPVNQPAVTSLYGITIVLVFVCPVLYSSIGQIIK